MQHWPRPSRTPESRPLNAPSKTPGRRRGKATQKVGRRQRTVLDGNGALEVAEALRDEVGIAGPSTAPLTERTAARTTVERCQRGVDVAETALVDAEEARAAREGELAAAEEHLAAVHGGAQRTGRR